VCGDVMELGSQNYTCKCPKCGRKILVEMGFFGVPHNTHPWVTCAQCLDIKDKYKKDHPERAKELEEWAKE